MTTEIIHQLPNDQEAERAVLGAILLDEQAIFSALDCLEPRDFYDARHRAIFEGMQRLARESRTVEPIAVRDELVRAGGLEKIGGYTYFTTLTDGLPRATNVEHYAAIIREHANKRRLVQIFQEAAQKALGPEFTSAEIIEDAERELLEIQDSRRESDFLPMSQLVASAYKDIEERSKNHTDLSGLETGFPTLNRMTGGFKPGNFVVIAARPGCGKTTLCLNLAVHAALAARKRVGIFSLEMSSGELVRRILCSQSSVDSFRIEGGYLNAENWRTLSAAASELSESRIHINDAGGVSITQIRAKAQRLAIKAGVDLLIVDYLQLVSPSERRRNESRVQEVSEITRGLKLLAKDLNIPVIAASQLNRGIEHRQGNAAPRLSDLRESGSIEQDADVVIFLHRPDMYNNVADQSSATDLIIGKQRNGPTGVIPMRFIREHTRFGEAAA